MYERRDWETFSDKDGVLKQWMRTYNGGTFYPLAPDVSQITPEIVAHHIAKAQRYAGAPEDDYTVAEHCWHISHCLEHDGYGVKIAMQGLLHDAPEFAFGDMIRPLKNAIRVEFPAAYDFLEGAHDRVCMMLAEKWGCGWPFDGIVKTYDERIVTDEVNQLFAHAPWHFNQEPLGIELHCWAWKSARFYWRKRFYELARRIEKGEQ